MKKKPTNRKEMVLEKEFIALDLLLIKNLKPLYY